MTYIFQAVLEVKLYSGIVKTAGSEGEIFLRHFHDFLIDLDHVDVLDGIVADELSDDTAIAGADHKCFSRIRMNAHRDVHHHLVIDKFILLGEHHIAVECEKTSELRRLENIDLLEVTLAAVELLADLDRKLDGRSMKFRKPKIHKIPLPISYIWPEPTSI